MSQYSPITKNARWFAGEKKIIQFNLPEAITGWAMVWVVRNSSTEDSTRLEKTTGDGITITDGPNGVCQVQVDAVDTADWDPIEGVHALWRTDVDEESLLAEGEAVVQRAAVP